MTHRQRRFYLWFAASVLLLWMVRLVALHRPTDGQPAEPSTAVTDHPSTPATDHPTAPASDDPAPHPIRSVPSYAVAFPDTQGLQIRAARHWGITPVRNRADASHRQDELVCVDTSPYYHVDRLTSSIPYLVPRAAVLLGDIGQAFFDSLYVKQLPLHQIIVTSVLRSADDVVRLRRHNGNATENSCHLYGTTFDICYNRYQPLGREVRNDTLKWVLAEVLRDQREAGRCYVKYEVKQGCFHITVR